MAKLTLSRAQHEEIQQKLGIGEDENYAVVTERGKGFLNRSVHVFERMPTTKEMTEYEQTASKLKFRGQKAEVEGSQALAAKDMYNHLIKRACNVLIGRRTVDELDRKAAIERVPLLTKREAIRDLVGGVWSEGQLADMEGDDEEMMGPGAKEGD